MKNRLTLLIFLIICNSINSAQSEFDIQTHYKLSTDSNSPACIEFPSRVVYRPNNYQYIDPDDMHQDTGMIILTEPSELSRDDYQITTKQIHELCKDPRNLPEATPLLLKMTRKEETVEEKRYRCAALMRLGEACLGLPYPKNLTLASSSFHQAAHIYKFSGAAFDLCLVISLLTERGFRLYQPGMTGVYWLEQAQQYGMKGIEHLEAKVKNLCEIKEEKKALKAAYHTEEDDQPNMHNID